CAPPIVASNYFMTRIDASVQMTGLAGLDEKEVKQMLQPLVIKSVNNITERPLSQALSGPIARADSGTVEKHLDLLSNNPNLKKEYIQLGLRTVHKAREAGRLTTADAGRLIKLLKEAR